MTNETLQQDRPSRWPHVFAVILACATFPLIWVGGLVTTYDAGMAVPDWPTTYGYNMFLYPISTWISGPWNLFIEHGHRLLGALVGILTIGLNVVIWTRDRRRWMRWVGMAVLLLVISQGVLGGMRVRLSSTDLARAHGITGPLFFALTVVVCVMTSRFWFSKRAELYDAAPLARRTVVNGWLFFALVYVQLILGAHLRHPNIDWSPALFRSVVVFHIIVALIVMVQAFQMAYQARALDAVIRRPARLIALLVVGQVALGVATWRAKYGLGSFFPLAENVVDQPYEIAMHDAVVGHTILNAGMLQVVTVTGHVALGALILATGVFYATRLTHCYAQGRTTDKATATATHRHVLSVVTAIGGTTP